MGCRCLVPVCHKLWLKMLKQKSTKPSLKRDRQSADKNKSGGQQHTNAVVANGKEAKKFKRIKILY